jgi:hypothetical protein
MGVQFMFGNIIIFRFTLPMSTLLTKNRRPMGVQWGSIHVWQYNYIQYYLTDVNLVDQKTTSDGGSKVVQFILNKIILLNKISELSTLLTKKRRPMGVQNMFSNLIYNSNLAPLVLAGLFGRF